ncbi:hypothetical protein [Methanosalsum natronophilum]|nr:hypothetical protein [Methanosalsum natronophilum]MCS3923224.1 hypothetical protein [Methanosalsum natronophilum]
MVIIGGTAFRLDSFNKNVWGVPASEANNAVESLNKTVVRICPRVN